MTVIAERAQKVHLALVCTRQLAAIAHAHHLRAAALGPARLARNVREVLRLLRVRDVDD